MLHNSSFWAWFVQRLLYDLTSGLVHTNRKKSEVEIRHDLLTPLLSWASHYAHITLRPETVNSEGETSTFEYSSAFELEPQTEWRPNTRGRNPQVDFALVGCVDGKPIYEIAVEAKAKLSIKDMSQLAQYMATLVNGIHTKPKTTVGLLLDQDTVQFAFSALCLPATYTPLSIVLVSPPLRWRSGTAVDRGVCIALCLLQKLTVKRVSVDEVKWKQVFGEELWGEVERVAKEIEEEGFLMQQAAASSTVPYDLLEDIEMLRNEVIMLRREVSKLQVQASPRSCMLSPSRLRRPPAKRPAMEEESYM